ncbi:hypothetical protein D3C87_1392020 [compost metagenome]
MKGAYPDQSFRPGRQARPVARLALDQRQVQVPGGQSGAQVGAHAADGLQAHVRMACRKAGQQHGKPGHVKILRHTQTQHTRRPRGRQHMLGLASNGQQPPRIDQHQFAVLGRRHVAAGPIPQ